MLNLRIYQSWSELALLLKSDETRELAKQIISLAATNRDLPDTSDQAFERFFSRRYV